MSAQPAKVLQTVNRAASTPAMPVPPKPSLKRPSGTSTTASRSPAIVPAPITSSGSNKDLQRSSGRQRSNSLSESMSLGGDRGKEVFSQLSLETKCMQDELTALTSKFMLITLKQEKEGLVKKHMEETINQLQKKVEDQSKEISVMKGQLRDMMELREMVQDLMNQTRFGTSASFSSSADLSSSQKEIEIVETALQKVNKKLGLQVAGGKDSKIGAIYVGHIVEGGAAHIDGHIKVGDMVLSVDGHDMRSMTNKEAIAILQQTGDVVHLRVSRSPAFRKELRRKGVQIPASPEVFRMSKGSFANGLDTSALQEAGHQEPVNDFTVSLMHKLAPNDTSTPISVPAVNNASLAARSSSITSSLSTPAITVVPSTPERVEAQGSKSPTANGSRSPVHMNGHSGHSSASEQTKAGKSVSSMSLASGSLASLGPSGSGSVSTVSTSEDNIQLHDLGIAVLGEAEEDMDENETASDGEPLDLGEGGDVDANNQRKRKVSFATTSETQYVEYAEDKLDFEEPEFYDDEAEGAPSKMDSGSVLAAKAMKAEMRALKKDFPGCSLKLITLSKKEYETSLGMTIQGGTSTDQRHGIFVESIRDDTPAARCGELCINDRILLVDSHNLRYADRKKAIDVLQGTGSVVQIAIVRRKKKSSIPHTYL